MTAPSFIVLSPEDNVAVASLAIEAGGELPGGVRATGKIDPGHKVAIHPVHAGEPVVKYGQAIGRATVDIAPGDHVHSHNLAFDQDRLSIGAPVPPEAASIADKARTFMGYRRADGRAATRNFIGIIASVNCSTTVCRAIAEASQQDHPAALRRYRRFRADRPRSGLRHELDRRRHEEPAPDACRLYPSREFRWRADGRARLRGQPVDALRPDQVPVPAKRHFNIQDAGGSRRAVARALGVLEEIARKSAQQTHSDPGQRNHRRPAMRRFGRAFGHHRESGFGCGGRYTRRCRRHGHPVGNLGNLRRRASAAQPGRQRGRRAKSSTD